LSVYKTFLDFAGPYVVFFAFVASGLPDSFHLSRDSDFPVLFGMQARGKVARFETPPYNFPKFLECNSLAGRVTA
jgi:hypothetical protein